MWIIGLLKTVVIVGLAMLLSATAWNTVAPAFGGPQLNVWQVAASFWLMFLLNFWYNNRFVLYMRQPDEDHDGYSSHTDTTK